MAFIKGAVCQENFLNCEYKMASGSSAFPAKAGYNQSGGAYYICLENLWLAQKLNTLTPGSGSGGATTVGSFAANDATSVANGANTSSFFGIGALIKDMGKTVTSSGRTFRKIQSVVGTHNNSSPTFGVGGNAASTTNPGYLTFYIEVGREGANADSGNSYATTGLAAVARYV
jgi:hypothetical protein